MPDGEDTQFGKAGSNPTLRQALDQRNQGKCGPLTGGPADSPDTPADGRFELDPVKLRDVINKWIQENESISHDGADLAWAGSAAQGPAPDVISEGYATTLRFVMSEFQRHNESMRTYSSANIDRLRASLDQYSATGLMTTDLFNMVQFLGTTESHNEG
jgi:hypothetical protein